MNYPTDEQFEEARTNRAPPRQTYTQADVDRKLKSMDEGIRQDQCAARIANDDPQCPGCGSRPEDSTRCILCVGSMHPVRITMDTATQKMQIDTPEGLPPGITLLIDPANDIRAPKNAHRAGYDLHAALDELFESEGLVEDTKQALALVKEVYERGVVKGDKSKSVLASTEQAPHVFNDLEEGEPPIGSDWRTAR